MVQLSYMGKWRENYSVNSWEWVSFVSLGMSCRSPGQNLPEGNIFPVENLICSWRNHFVNRICFPGEKLKEINKYLKQNILQTNTWKLKVFNSETLHGVVVVASCSFLKCRNTICVSLHVMLHGLVSLFHLGRLICGTAWRTLWVGAVPLKRRVRL